MIFKSLVDFYLWFIVFKFFGFWIFIFSFFGLVFCVLMLNVGLNFFSIFFGLMFGLWILILLGLDFLFVLVGVWNIDYKIIKIFYYISLVDLNKMLII